MLSLFTYFSIPILMSSIMLRSINMHSENKAEAISEVLEIQKSLLIPLEAEELPDFSKNGFLIVKMNRDYLENFLVNGEMIVAYDQDNIVGYLLLEKMDAYINWARNQNIVSDLGLDDLKRVKYIDQIGIQSRYAKKGIGTALINEARLKSPNGMLTDTLVQPFPNPAALAFFSKMGFLDVGLIRVQANEVRPAHEITMLLWLP